MPSKRMRHLEYFLLHHATPAGPPVGSYGNLAIPEAVVDDSGRQYRFAGVAP